MSKTVFTIAFIALGGLSLFFGDIKSQLLNIGVGQDYLDIGKAFLDDAIKTVGIIAVAVLGLSLPPLPVKDVPPIK